VGTWGSFNEWFNGELDVQHGACLVFG